MKRHAFISVSIYKKIIFYVPISISRYISCVSTAGEKIYSTSLNMLGSKLPARPPACVFNCLYLSFDGLTWRWCLRLWGWASLGWTFPSFFVFLLFGFFLQCLSFFFLLQLSLSQCFGFLFCLVQRRLKIETRSTNMERRKAIWQEKLFRSERKKL